jgi:hypothetical protein
MDVDVELRCFRMRLENRMFFGPDILQEAEKLESSRKLELR